MSHDRMRRLRRLDAPALALPAESRGFLELPESDAADRMYAEIASGEPIGRDLGPYRIIHVLARGGMGTVYCAVRADDAYDTQVAIKLINRGMDSASLVRRFHQERQVLAGLDHPNIARLLDGGTTDDGRPYLVMQFVRGRPIDAFCEDRRLDLAARLRLFLVVCGAVHYAHQNLVVHRDLKPSNILVTDDGVAYLLDFGISKLIEDGSPTRAAAVTAADMRILTPQYASPEQIRGVAITTASDVYSLGVVLYELLTDRRPYKLDALPSYEKERVVCETDPAWPSAAVERTGRTRRRLRGDLDRIVLKAMSKDPSRRYATVRQFAEDIERHLDGRPVEARGDTRFYRASRFVRRNKAVVTACLAVAVALVAGTTLAVAGLQRARIERASAIQAKTDAENVTRFLQQMLAASNPYRSGREMSVRELLVDASRRITTDLAGQPRLQSAVHMAVAETYAGMWEWAEAADHAREALVMHRALGGDRSEAVASCLNLLGRALTFLKDPAAVKVQRENLAIRRGLYGDGNHHWLLAESHGVLGFALWHAVQPPRFDEAERYYRAAIEMFEKLERRRRTGPSRDRARFTYGLATMEMTRGRLDESDALFREVVRIYETTAGSDDRYAMEALQTYAQLLIIRGDDEQAEVLTRKVLELAPDDYAAPTIARAAWQLGLIRQRRGALDEAERLYVRAVAMECELAAEPDFANELRVARPTSKRLDEIVMRQTEAGTGRARCRLSKRLHQLAILRLDQNLPQRAGTLARRAAEIAGVCYGEDDGSAAASRDLLRRCEERTGGDA